MVPESWKFLSTRFTESTIRLSDWSKKYQGIVHQIETKKRIFFEKKFCFKRGLGAINLPTIHSVHTT